MKPALFLNILGCLLAMVSPALAWNPQLIDAVTAFSQGDRSPRVEAVILANIEEINLMRIKGVISDGAYQSSQGFYSDFTRDLGQKVCADHGVTMQVQQRDPAKAFDAGTDSDFITTATSAEQTEAIKKEFNRRYQERVAPYVQVDSDTQWVVKNDVDFMSEPSGISPEAFSDIARANNDAYKRRNAAFYEMKVRNGQQVSPDEAADYIDEMREFIEKKKDKSRALSDTLLELNQAPDFRKPGTATYRQRMMAEAGLQKTNAQEAKYFDRIIDATNRLGELTGLEFSASALPGQAKKRAPGSVNTPDGSPAPADAKHREILAASVQASHRHLDQQTRMNEALLISVQMAQNPAAQHRLEQRFVEVVAPLPPARQAEVIERIRTANPDNDPRIQLLNTELKKANTPPLPAPASFTPASLTPTSLRLPKFSDAAGLVGDLMGMAGALKDAADGKHLLFGFDQGDSAAIQSLKSAGAILTEMAPVPVIDLLENAATADDRIKQRIQQMIARGKAVDPVAMTAEVFAETLVNTYGGMVITPMLDTVTSLGEGINTLGALYDNQAAYEQGRQDDRNNNQRFDRFENRMQAIGLGVITARGETPQGQTYTLLDNVHEGDRLEFTIARTDRWKAGQTVCWEIYKDHTRIQSWTRMPALEENAHRLGLVNRLPPGDYIVRFRLFDADGKQMDYADCDMTVSSEFGMSALAVYDDQNRPLSTPQVYADSPCTLMVKPLGRWSDAYTIEWFWDASRLRRTPGNAADSHRIRLTPENYGALQGAHKVTVRALKEGNIIAARSLTVQVKAGPVDPQPQRPATIRIGDIVAATRPDALDPAPDIFEDDTLYLHCAFDLHQGGDTVGIDMTLVDTGRGTTLFRHHMDRPDQVHPSLNQEIKLKIPPSSLYKGQHLSFTLAFSQKGVPLGQRQIALAISGHDTASPRPPAPPESQEPHACDYTVHATKNGKPSLWFEMCNTPSRPEDPAWVFCGKSFYPKLTYDFTLDISDYHWIGRPTSKTDLTNIKAEHRTKTYPKTKQGWLDYLNQSAYQDINRLSNYDDQLTPPAMTLVYDGITVMNGLNRQICQEGNPNPERLSRTAHGEPAGTTKTDNALDPAVDPAEAPAGLDRCRALKRDLDQAKQAYTTDEEQYLTLVKQFAAGWKTHAKVRQLTSRLHAIEDEAKTVTDQAAWQTLKSEHTRLKTQLNEFGSQVQSLLNILTGSRTTACGTALQHIMGQRDLFDAMAGAGSWSEISNACVRMVDQLRRADSLSDMAKQENCNQFGASVLDITSKPLNAGRTKE